METVQTGAEVSSVGVTREPGWLLWRVGSAESPSRALVEGGVCQVPQLGISLA